MNSCQRVNLAVARFRMENYRFFIFFLHSFWNRLKIPGRLFARDVICSDLVFTHNTQIAEKHHAIDPRRRSVGRGSFDTSVQATGRYLEALKMKKRGRPNVSTVFQSVRSSSTLIWTGQLGTVLLAERLQPDNIASNCLHYYIWLLIGLGKGIFKPVYSD